MVEAKSVLDMLGVGTDFKHIFTMVFKHIELVYIGTPKYIFLSMILLSIQQLTAKYLLIRHLPRCLGILITNLHLSPQVAWENIATFNYFTVS